MNVPYTATDLLSVMQRNLAEEDVRRRCDAATGSSGQDDKRIVERRSLVGKISAYVATLGNPWSRRRAPGY
jgi:hypothetical protein